jgi:hypothetical protein
MERVFTLGEANSLIPELENLLLQIRSARRYLQSIQPEIQKARDQAEPNGGSAQGPLYLKGLEYIIQRLEKIQEMGVLVKDLERGLCDFPFMRDGDMVYLCWKLGEPEIQWWHALDTGFAGRQPLGDETDH